MAAMLAGPALGCAMPGVAHAQAQIAGNPLTVHADGLGRLQFRFNGQAAGVFFPPEAQAANAGLEIREGSTTYLLGSAVSVSRPTLTSAGAGTQTLRSVYTVGPNLQVTEDVTYTDGTQSVRLRYVIQNVSLLQLPVGFAAGALADLYAAGSDEGAGVHQAGPPQFVGGRSANGALTGLVETTPWAHFQAGEYGAVFSSFAAGGLNDLADPSVQDNGAGAEWAFPNVAAGDTRTIDVTWQVGDTAAAPIPIPIPAPAPAPAPPVTPVQAALPPPAAGKTVNALTKSGTVLIKLPGKRTFLALGPGQQIPVGTTVDATEGRVTLTAAADRQGGTQTADFYDGIFKVGQTQGAKPITELALVEELSCPAGKASASAAAARKKSRKLWGDGSGRFRTRGQFSSATVRGTIWLTEDRCGRTLTRVKRGVVAVRDFGGRKTVLVKAGKQYLARAKRR